MKMFSLYAHSFINVSIVIGLFSFRKSGKFLLGRFLHHYHFALRFSQQKMNEMCCRVYGEDILSGILS